MKILTACLLALLLLPACTEQRSEPPATPATPPAVATAPATAPPAAEQPVATEPATTTEVNENHEQGTWTGQLVVGKTVSMVNYVGAESGDFAPMRFENESAAGKKILAACSNGAMCEFTGAIEWLDEVPPPDASAIGRIVRVDSVKRGVEPAP